MGKTAAIQKLEQRQLKRNVGDFHVGDTIRVHTRVIEGEKERVQVFTGTVIARKGAGISETFTVHRVAYGEGMERVFPIHSPRIVKIEVVKEGAVRRSKLYYLRGTSGKASKVKGRLGPKRLSQGGEQEQQGGLDHQVVDLETSAVETSSATAESETTKA